ncbi:MAG: hypothetical protein OEY01_10770 [Desulfobulbaceae bacterium]|nr:hypothetical protein [Desulfobulbaceae bacterium]
MTPEQLAAINALLGVLQMVSQWPVGVLVIVVLLGPWGLILFLSTAADRRDRANEKRFDAVVQMYEDNVELVKTTQTITSDLRDIVIMNTQEWQKAHGKVQSVREDIAGNKFCPMLRVGKEKTIGVPK